MTYNVFGGMLPCSTQH